VENKDDLEQRLERILGKYGALLTKLGGVSCSEDGKYSLSERAEKARLNMIKCFLNKGILSYERSGNYEIRWFYELRFDEKILTGPENRPLYCTNRKYAHKLIGFIEKYVCPGSNLIAAEVV